MAIRLQFGMRALMIAMTVSIAVPSILLELNRRSMREEDAIRAVRRHSLYEYEVELRPARNRPFRPPRKRLGDISPPTSLARRLFGNLLTDHIYSIHLDGSEDHIEKCGRLGDVRIVSCFAAVSTDQFNDITKGRQLEEAYFNVRHVAEAALLNHVRHNRRLRVLCLYDGNITPELLRRIGTLPELKELGFERCILPAKVDLSSTGSVDAVALKSCQFRGKHLEWHWPEQLRILDIRGTRLSVEQVQEFPWPSGATSVRLSGSNLERSIPPDLREVVKPIDASR